MVLVHSGCYNKHHRLGGLKTTEMYFSQFWRWEARDQGAEVRGLSRRRQTSCLPSRGGRGTALTHGGSALVTQSPPKGPVSQRQCARH